MKIKYILVLGLYLFAIDSFGHDQNVHEAITFNAAQSAYDESSTYHDFVDTISADLDYTGQNGATNSMVKGSFDEDFIDQDVGGKRSLNHFYDPITGKGLSNIIPDDRITPFGQDSFTWVSISNCPGLHVIEVATMNQWSWPNARSYEWLGLTATNQSQRQTNLAGMFRSVGQVMHLLEDCSQPQHVRNEQHLDTWWVDGPAWWKTGPNTPWRSPIEDYYKNYPLHYVQGILDWRGAGFTKLEDFWNRHLYAPGSATVLANAENGGAQLGLAEWCNGNFLAARHLFPEFFNPGSVEYYPFPSRDTSTDYADIKAHPAHGVDLYRFPDGTVGKGIYLAKTSDGITYNHIARVNYLGAKISGLTGPRYCTIADPNVLGDYHDKFIPKAVEYSAGLLDYFFRGTMDVSVVGFNTNSMQYTNRIVNTSGQDFSAGTFSIFRDDTNGVRTLVAQTNFSGQTLPNSNSMIMTFPASVPQSTNFLLVYQGTIGMNGTTALDPVDAGISIAAKQFTLGIDWTQLEWEDIGYPNYGPPSPPSQGTFNFNKNVFSVIASGSVYNKQDEGLFIGRMTYNGPGAQSHITLNGVLQKTWYADTSLTIGIRYQGESFFSSSVLNATDGTFTGGGTPQWTLNLSNYSLPITVPATGGVEKTVEVLVYWGAGVGEGYGGDSGYMNVSGTLTSP
jgi:hypothetical protein